jgi:hypothetical protein
MDWRAGIRFPAGTRFFSLHCPDGLLGPIQPPIQWVPGALSVRVKWLRHEADHSPQSSAKVKNGGAIPPLPNMSS